MQVYHLDRDSTEKQVIQDLVEAGQLLPSEIHGYIQYLSRLSWVELLEQVVTAYDLLKQAKHPTKFYPVDESGLVMN